MAIRESNRCGGQFTALLAALLAAAFVLGASGNCSRLRADDAPADDAAAATDADEKASADASAAEDQPKPTTTGNPDISLADLKLMVKPLTRDELAVEAEAWRELLKGKLQAISDLQIRVNQKAAEMTATQAAGEDAAGSEETGADAAGDQDAAKTKTEQAGAEKEAMTEQIPALQDEKLHLIDRLDTVVDAWELKGGEVEEFRTYIIAVSGIDVTATDAATTFTVLKGWVTSEQGGLKWAWNIGKFLAILGAFYVLALILSGLVAKASMRIQGASELLRKFLTSFVKQVVMVVGVIVAISALELNISPLLAAIGGAAFVVGLALQGTLSNFASGLIILGYRPFDVGDVIEAAGIAGIVDSMNLISTKIRTFDNKVMIVPNNKIATDTITNATASPTRRVDLVFGIGYDDDVERAKGILTSLVENHQLVLKDPAPVVQLHELADSSVNFVCRPWVKSSDYWTVYWDMMRSVKEEFDRSGITIPYPQREVHVVQHSADKPAENAVG